MFRLQLLALLCFLSIGATAQTFSVKGKIQDADEKKSVANATIRITAQNDSLISFSTMSDNKGLFTFNGLSPRLYLLYISSIGYDSLRQTVIVNDSNMDLKTIDLYKGAKTLGGITVTATTPPVKQKGDTLEYSASAFKVNPDAMAQDMIKKMPGVTIDATGAVTAGGETVRKVTIDGREFFGEDASAALKNLPADIIDKVQVFDRLSDQAQFSGFDDGNTSKSINIVTKADMRNGQFGRVYAGYGTDERYAAGGNMSFFNENRRVSLVGLFNNINQQNFGTQDLLGVTSNGSGRGGGAGGRGSGGGRARGGGGQGGGMGNWGQNNNFQVGQQNGISKTNAAGINYSDLWGKKIEATGSYFFNNSRNANNEISSTQYLGDRIGEIFNDTSFASSNNFNHRANLRLEYKIDSSNTLILTPNLSFQKNTSLSNLHSTRVVNIKDITSDVSQFTDQKRNGYNLRNELLYRHAFAKKGRTFSININTALNKNAGEIFTNSLSNYYDIVSNSDTINQFRDQQTNGYTLGSNLSYTEPIGKKGQLEFTYNPNYTFNKADQITYDYDDDVKSYSLFNRLRSNKFDNSVTTHRSGLSYRIGTRDNMISIGGSYQYTELASEQIFPSTLDINKSFNNFLPNIMINKKLSPKSSIRVNYRTSTNAPSVSQLQNVYDDSNPLQWSVGNPDLKQQFTHSVSGRYTFTNSVVGNSLFANAFVQKVDNYISNAIFIAQADSFRADFPSVLRSNSQLTKPINLNGYWNFRSFLVYSMPVKFIKSNFNVNGGYMFSRLPGQIDNNVSVSNSNTLNVGASLVSNISEYIDFNLSYGGNFNEVKNKNQPLQNTNYYSHTAGLQLNMLSKSGWLFQNDVNNQFYNGLTEGFNQSFWLWNMSVGKKFLKEQKAEIKLSVFDLLKENQSIVRNVNANYIEDVQNQVLQQYFMLTFTYKLRSFGKGKQSNNSSNDESGPRPYGPPSGGGFQRPGRGF